MRKIVLLCLAVVLALGALGVGYASWTDTIFIDGSVSTGSLDINAVYFSSTEIWKDLDTDAYVWYHYYTDAQGNVKEGYYYGSLPPANGELVAYAYCTPGLTDDTVDIEVAGAFPEDGGLYADVIIHCDGTVPVKVDGTISSDDAWLEYLWENYWAYYWGYYHVTVSDPPGGPFYMDWGDSIYELPIQMHPCEYALLYLYLEIPQEDAFMDQTGSFTVTLTATQWNEYSD